MIDTVIGLREKAELLAKKFLPKTFKIVFIIYFMEAMVGGPGQWRFEPLPPIRHMLFGAVVVLYIVDLARRGASTFDRSVLLWTFALMGVWAILIPLLSGASVADGISDARPLVAVLAAPITLRLLRQHRLTLDELVFWLYVGVIVVVVLHVAFAINLYINGHRVGQDAAEYFFCLHIQCPGIYVGGMPGGGLRVHWVGSIFLVAALVAAMARNNMVLAVLWSVALYFSWSRSLWISSLVVIIGMLVMMGKKFPFRVLIVAAVVFFLLDMVVTSQYMTSAYHVVEKSSQGASSPPSLVSERIGQEGLGIRVAQVAAHFEKLRERPIFGTGFGVPAGLIRSESAPWSYESTYTALAYKLGLVGMAIGGFPVLILVLKLARQATLTILQKLLLLITLGLLVVGGFNPYLFNAVGVTFLAILYGIIYRDSEVASSHSGAG